MRNTIAEYNIHDMKLIYERGITRKGNDCTGMVLVPADMADQIAADKEYDIEPLIQVKIVGDDYPFNYSQGRTMRNSRTTMEMSYGGQEIRKQDGRKTIVTFLKDGRGIEYEHYVSFFEDSEALEVSCRIMNRSASHIMLEMLSSFTLGALTPFVSGIAGGHMALHQIRSTWANEGRLVSRPVEEYQLEPSWKPSGANGIRFGQVGSMPNREYFPFIGIEDKQNEVCWGAQLAIGGSWQLEAYRKDDALCISGGIADREKGHWLKRLDAGREFMTPKAVISAVKGDIDKLCQRLTGNIRRQLRIHPDEQDMPVIFNEFCTTWGHPDADQIKRIADLCKKRGIRYFVIDAGWYKRDAADEDGWSTEHGDWIPNQDLFPDGIGEITDYIHKMGMKAGIWFEFENCGRKSALFEAEKLLCKRDGVLLTAGNRRFLDMTNPEAEEYLDTRVLAFLKEHHFDYIKVDYNANLGIGPDGCESFGAALYESVKATENYMKKLKREIPGLLIENCCAGGHRLTEPFLRITDMSSYSDAHESMNIPIVAANMHRMIPVRQSQIWAVIHPEYSDAMIYYKMSSTLLGRMCLSGNVEGLSPKQWGIIEEAIAFYSSVSEIIDLGTSEIESHTGLSYKEPAGYQIVSRVYGGRKLLVVHTFAQCPEELCLGMECYKVTGMLKHCSICVEENGSRLWLRGLKPFDGLGICMEAMDV